MAKAPDIMPSSFSPDKQYTIRVKRAVALPGAEHHIMRPSDVSNVVLGSVAEQIKDALLSAIEVPTA